MGTDLQAAWRQQIEWCRVGGSPFTASVLEAAWQDWADGGPLREVLPAWLGDPSRDAVPLRVAAALHSLVLDGSDPTLTDFYPPHRTDFDLSHGPDAVRQSLRTHRDRIANYLERPPQTNEIGRSGVLLGGFAVVAQHTTLPFNILEIGASAGLNLLWHRFRYELDAAFWGDEASPVMVRCKWEGAAPALPTAIAVARYAGCDSAPIELSSPSDVVRLLSYVWPDQTERLDRLRSAIVLAQRERISVVRSDAHDFLVRELARAREGMATVIYHSIVWQYLPAETQTLVKTLIERTGANATSAAPVAWLTLEPPASLLPRLSLRFWPGELRFDLGEAHPHGQFVRWQVRLTDA